MNEIDNTIDNTKDIAWEIFKNSPGLPNSIDLQLDESTIDFIENGNDLANCIKNIISSITLHGIEILYGHKNIYLLSNDDLILIKQYTRSYGYELHANINFDEIKITFTRI